MFNSAYYRYRMKRAMYSASPEQSWYINIMFETNTLTSQQFIFYWNVWIRSTLIGGNASAHWWEKKITRKKTVNKNNIQNIGNFNCVVGHVKGVVSASQVALQANMTLDIKRQRERESGSKGREAHRAIVLNQQEGQRNVLLNCLVQLN